MSNRDDISKKEIVYSTELHSGRKLRVTPFRNKCKGEFLIILKGSPVFSNKTPLLLRQDIVKVEIFSLIENSYLKTILDDEDTLTITNLIKYTDLNKYSVLFADIEILS